MAKKTKTKSNIVFQKQIKTKRPDAYAEITLQFDGVMEHRVTELRELFNQFYAEVAGIVLEDTSLYV